MHWSLINREKKSEAVLEYIIIKLLDLLAY